MKKLLSLILAITFSAVALADTPGWQTGAVASQNAVQQVLAVALKLNPQYKAPPFLPVMLVVEDATLSGKICPDGSCKVWGAVEYAKPEVIYLNVTTPPELREAVMVHEMVHVLQAASGHIPSDCYTAQADELEAHAAGMRYLSAQGFTGEINLPDFSCGGPK